MAFMSQENKKALAPAIKAALKKYNMKGSIGVENLSTLVVNLPKGKLDIIKNSLDNMKNTMNYITNRSDEEVAAMRQSRKDAAYIQVNPYNIDRAYSGEVKQFLLELREAMMTGNHDNSDVMTDYFDVGWYISINVGKWNKPYVVTV
jgi:hypothetical protein